MTRKITTAALLAAVALIIFVVEAQIPTLTPVPGIKLGLSNIVTLFALYSIGPWFALAVLAVRILLGGLITGQVMALLYSFSGGLLAFFVSIVIYRFFRSNKFGLSARLQPSFITSARS
jgi:heptaprenyl diphosphate synthase